MQGTGWPTLAAASFEDAAEGGQFEFTELTRREHRRRGGGFEEGNVQPGRGDGAAEHRLVFGEAPEEFGGGLGPVGDIFAKGVDAAQVKGDGEGAGDGDAHVGLGELLLEPAADGEDHGDAAIALGVEWFQCQPVLQ